MNSLMRKLHTAQSKYYSSVGAVEASIADSVKFEFSIEHKESDGFTLINADASSVACLDKCLDFIKENGILTEDDHSAFVI